MSTRRPDHHVRCAQPYRLLRYFVTGSTGSTVWTGGAIRSNRDIRLNFVLDRLILCGRCRMLRWCRMTLSETPVRHWRLAHDVAYVW